MNKSIRFVVNCGIRFDFLPHVINSIINQSYEGYIEISLQFFGNKTQLEKICYLASEIHGRKLIINECVQPEEFFNISYANNIGAFGCETDLLIFTPADIIFPKYYVKEVVLALQDHNAKCIRAGTFYVLDSDTTKQALKLELVNAMSLIQEKITSLCLKISAMDGIFVTDAVLFRKAWYDESFFSQEDTDFMIRVGQICRREGLVMEDFRRLRNISHPFHLFHLPSGAHFASQIMKIKIYLLCLRIRIFKQTSLSALDSPSINLIESKASLGPIARFVYKSMKYIKATDIYFMVKSFYKR